jgi:hypothetical protein
MAGIEELKSKLISKGGLAMNNQFLVNLPSMGGVDSRTMNVLCKEVSLPGRQILTLDRPIAMVQEKVANGFSTEDVSMTFYVTNDYAPKKYFDKWKSEIIVKKDDHLHVGYRDNYSRDIFIRQLKKPIARFGFDLGPLDFNLDVLGKSIYSVKLINAFPTSMSSIQLNSDQDQIVEFSVQFSYTDWEVIKNEKDGLSPSIGLNLGGLI